MKNFIDYLEGVFEHLDLAREDLILMGDFNIDFLDKNSQDFKLLNNLIKQTGLDILINKPTHFSSQKNSCIDQILTNSNFIENSDVEDFNLSDHQLIYTIRKKPKKPKEN